MSHAIYYTSAPEGLRPGQRGFCTVAATEALPRPLWDRLESFSTYRHEFSAGSGRRNPVSWAHWLMSFQGRELSILSRVADAGLDYTQRTNAFAHHLALDPGERSAGGPAWLLSRPGVMATQWDGRVAPLPEPRLPNGDVRPTACTAWQRLTGDAGWGGVLAETGLRHPRKPVCILFAPDQDVLPLIAEAIALMPAARRWDVTFNTYFTGLPGNAVCAWRCCLAGTPAASDAVRHAGAGLVIDLTRPGAMGAPPAGPWVDAARNGKPPAGTTGPALRPRPAAKAGRVAATADAGSDPEPIDVVPVDDADADVSVDTAFVVDVEPVSVVDAGPAPRGSVAAAGVSRAVDTTWIEQQRQSRRWLLIGVTAVALLFIAAGIWLRTSANRATAERPLDLSTTPEAVPPPPEPTTREAEALTVAVIPKPIPITPPTTVEVKPVDPKPTPRPVKPPPPVVPIQLATEVLAPVTTGAALKAPTQVVEIPAADFDNLAAVAAFRIRFPGDAGTYTYRQKDLAGVLSTEASGGFRYQLIWRDDANKAVPIEVATVAFEPTSSSASLEIGWRMKALLNRPEVVSLVRVLLHNADLIVADAANKRPQPIRFRQPEAIEIDLLSPASPLKLSPLPEASCTVAGMLPEGWSMTWSNGPTTRGAEHESEVGTLQFSRPMEGGEPSRFSVRIGPRWSSALSDFATQLLAARQAASQATAAVTAAEQEANRLRDALKAVQEPVRKDLSDARDQLKLSDTELAARFTNRTSLRTRIKNAETRLEELAAAWAAEIEKAVQRREPAERARVAAESAVRGFERFKEVEITVELPGKLRVATLRLKAP